MKFELFILLNTIFLMSGCSVELRDKGDGVSIPKELVINNDYVLPPMGAGESFSEISFDRLVFKPGGQLITGGQNVRIYVKELISEQGTIRTFKANQTAAPLLMGRGGGGVELNIQSGSGNLLIEMQGERGGKGMKGNDPDESLKGLRGDQATMGICFPDIFDPRKINYSEYPSSGKVGGPGKSGYPGKPGLNGGATGRITVKIQDAYGLNIDIQKYPGLGGEGGDGGDGGSGGNGGLGTLGCDGKDISPGPQGPQGPQGAQGPNGAEGVIEVSCIETNLAPMQCQ